MARNDATLQQAKASILHDRVGTTVHTCSADLGTATGLEAVGQAVEALGNRLSLLVCCAGEFRFENDLTDLAAQEAMFAVNAIGPYRLARGLLPALQQASGYVVFVNSSIVLRDAPEAATYAASRHALRAYANALRSEVSSSAVRVLSVFLGRTATEAQEHIMAREGRPYIREHLLAPEEVAESVLEAISLSTLAEITELFLRPGRPYPAASVQLPQEPVMLGTRTGDFSR